MITIIAKRETGYFDFELGHVTELNIWEQMCAAFSVDQLILTPNVGNTTFEPFESIEKALKNVSGMKVFLEEEKRATEIGREPIYLDEFQHPDDVVYIFGSAGFDTSKLVTTNDILVSVKTDKNIDMFGISVASMVLYDRALKFRKVN